MIYASESVFQSTRPSIPKRFCRYLLFDPSYSQMQSAGKFPENGTAREFQTGNNRSAIQSTQNQIRKKCVHSLPSPAGLSIHLLISCAYIVPQINCKQPNITTRIWRGNGESYPLGTATASRHKLPSSPEAPLGQNGHPQPTPASGSGRAPDAAPPGPHLSV